MVRLIDIERAPLSAPLDDTLPTEAINKGYGLSWWSPAAFGRDPVILYKHNKGVHRWNYIPSLTAVWEKIQELEVANVR